MSEDTATGIAECILGGDKDNPLQIMVKEDLWEFVQYLVVNLSSDSLKANLKAVRVLVARLRGFRCEVLVFLERCSGHQGHVIL